EKANTDWPLLYQRSAQTWGWRVEVVGGALEQGAVAAAARSPAEIAMPLQDDVVDLVVRLRSSRSAEESVRQWPSILSGLGKIRDRLGAMKPHLRRDPSADWLHRTLMDCEAIGDGRRAEALEMIATIKAMVGPSTPAQTQH